jgi:hypothetical protein
LLTFGIRGPQAPEESACLNVGICCRSGEVDVVSETGLSGTLKQPKQGHTLFSTRSAPDDNDDAIMWLRRREMQKIVPVAGQEYTTSLMRKPENCLVGRVARKGPAQQGDIMAELLI